jgi:hypothetical protein
MLLLSRDGVVREVATIGVQLCARFQLEIRDVLA